VEAADDTLPANQAYRLACEGTALLWRGDFQNARQLLQAMARRIDGGGGKDKRRDPGVSAPDITATFHAHRMAQAQRARILGLLLMPLQADFTVPLRRAPDLREACAQVWAPGAAATSVASLRELLGLVGAFEWRRKGVYLSALGASIHPHYGVFSPVRGEYVALVAQAPLPAGTRTAFDIGTGTGVLAAVLARRHVPRVLATDSDPRALACARDNLTRLQLLDRVEVQQADLFPTGQAQLIVCNPPWLPGKPATPIEHAIYDPQSRMLRGFLHGVAAHLAPGGEAWLILSDLAEHLGLRRRDELLEWIAQAGLRVLGRIDTRPQHSKASDTRDALHAARGAEVTSLWRLGRRD
jgi:methylase of polypeptide subunit release factors